MTGEATAIRENGASSGVGGLASYGYDDIGRRTSVTRGNGTMTSYGYDNVSRLASLTQDLAGSGDDLALGFGYNKASQIASATRSNDGYAWTGSANAAKGYAVNGLNQLTAAAGASVSHDARGNVTAIGGSSYGYSSENLLTSAPGGVTLGYDPLMRLYTTSGSGMRFRYDGVDLIGEVDGSGVLQKRYVHGDGVDEPIVEYVRNGSGTYDRKWLHADERGSIVAQSNDAGARTSVNSYDEYGVPASGNVGRFQYTGQAWLPDVGLYYYKSRMLAAQLGRFMHTDPIGYDGGMNWYAYVANDPVNFVDPTGLKCEADEQGNTPEDCNIKVAGKKNNAPVSTGWAPFPGSTRFPGPRTNPPCLPGVECALPPECTYPERDCSKGTPVTPPQAPTPKPKSKAKAKPECYPGGHCNLEVTCSTLAGMEKVTGSVPVAILGTAAGAASTEPNSRLAKSMPVKAAGAISLSAGAGWLITKVGLNMCPKVK